MIIRFFRDKFSARCRDNAGNSLFRQLFEGPDETVIIGRMSGKLYSYEVTAEADSIRRQPYPFWIGNDEDAALIDIRTRKVLAFVRHDGFGKYYPIVYVSLVRALRLSRSLRGTLVSLRSFPRCTVELFYSRSIEDAQGHVHYVLDGGS